jgi:hypothetical protein
MEQVLARRYFGRRTFPNLPTSLVAEKPAIEMPTNVLQTESEEEFSELLAGFTGDIGPTNYSERWMWFVAPGLS